MADPERMHALFSPRSIAIVGASDDPSRIGGRPLKILTERGFEGAIYPVNPRQQAVQGRICYRAIADLPDDIDLYVLCVASERAVDLVEQAAQKGARAAVVFSGGFAEIGPSGAALQDRLSEIVERTGIALVGPNSLGVASFANATFATFATALSMVSTDSQGEIAIVSQSGGTGFNLLAEAGAANAHFSHVIATGNEAGLEFSDYLVYLADDPATSSVIGYVEGVRDGGALSAALQRLQEAGKPVFLLKGGASERGRVSVESHTAQMSGDESAYDALFSRYGAVRLRTMQEAIDVARALSLGGAGSPVAVATNSGGAAAYIADACERYGVPLADLGTATTTRLQEELPDFASVVNPVDFTAQVINDPGLLGRTLRALDPDPGVDLILVFLGSMGSLSEPLWDSLEQAQLDLRTPMVVSWLGVSEQVRSEGMRRGLNVADDPARVLCGLGLVRQARRFKTSRPRGIAASTEGTGGIQLVREDEVLDQLDRWGLPTPRRSRVRIADDLVSAAESVGFPCVLKMTEPVLEHRAVAGAVRLGLRDLGELRAAFDDLTTRHGMTSGLVARQYEIDAELIVGLVADRTFGTRAVIGIGGVWANAVDDVRVLVPPYTASYVRTEMEELRGREWLLNAAARSATELAHEVAQYLDGLVGVLDEDDLMINVECNPLAVTSDGVLALDALAARREETA